jgi:putative iron-only hydrogenase system regulator
MSTRVAALSIIVDNPDSVGALNEVLHEAAGFIVGRMGIPYRTRGISIISIVLDAPEDAISAISGKIGALNGVSIKCAYSSYEFD